MLRIRRLLFLAYLCRLQVPCIIQGLRKKNETKKTTYKLERCRKQLAVLESNRPETKYMLIVIIPFH